MPLTYLEIKRLESKSKDYWVTDEKGLRLLIKKNGSKYWRMKYRFNGKQKTLALGVYPDVSLKEARIERDKAKIQLSKGLDPNEERQALKDKSKELFSALAQEWWEQKKGLWTEKHANRLWTRLRDNSFNELDKISIEKILPKDILKIVHQIESRDALDVATRVLQDIRRIFRYGVQIGKLTDNPAGDLIGIVRARKRQHHPSLPIDELGQFMLELSGYEKRGFITTKLSIQLLILTFVRSGELRKACWSEFDFKKKLWRIPAERMKMKTEHLVPLSKQVLSILDELKLITGQFDLLFPSKSDHNKSISNSTFRLAIYRMGYDGKTNGKSHAVPHGFRANASSILNEQGFNPDAIERQLSHIERNQVRGAYTHHAVYMEERAKMMQWWADYLDNRVSKETA